MTSVGQDFPRQQERVRKLRERYLVIGDEAEQYAAEVLDGVLTRAAEAQSSGDIVRILRSYGELKECE